jgi:hypothetical protein
MSDLYLVSKIADRGLTSRSPCSASVRTRCGQVETYTQRGVVKGVFDVDNLISSEWVSTDSESLCELVEYQARMAKRLSSVSYYYALLASWSSLPS